MKIEEVKLISRHADVDQQARYCNLRARDLRN
ncbi:MAG: hypothetical protein ACI8XV_002849 [Arenicella sp.]|jgi:hypothetical protein